MAGPDVSNSVGDMAHTDWPTVIVSIIALLVSILVAARQAAMATKQAVMERDLSGKDRLLSQRQMFVTIWPQISTLSAIDPARPVEVDVIRAANALELVAVCWEADVVDRDLIRRSFSESFIRMYDAIDQVPKLPRGDTGREILRAAPAIGAVYGALRKESEEDRAITRLEPTAPAA